MKYPPNEKWDLHFKKLLLSKKLLALLEDNIYYEDGKMYIRGKFKHQVYTQLKLLHKEELEKIEEDWDDV